MVLLCFFMIESGRSLGKESRGITNTTVKDSGVEVLLEPVEALELGKEGLI